MNKQITYREELNSLKFSDINNETHVPNYIVILYHFMSWLCNICRRREGYISNISIGYNNENAIDIIKVLILVINDNIEIIDDKYKNKIVIINKYLNSIIENLDKSIRSKPGLMYDDENEDDDEILDCDMIVESNAKIIDILSDDN